MGCEYVCSGGVGRSRVGLIGGGVGAEGVQWGNDDGGAGGEVVSGGDVD
jgi:hypothetical protein